MPEIIVAKFGGTSLADAEAIKQTAKVMLEQKANVVVVSATSDTTNQLQELMVAIKENDRTKAEKLIKTIEQNHLKIAEELAQNSSDVATLIAVLKNFISNSKNFSYPEIKDEIFSYGERLSSTIFNNYCASFAPVKLVDAREIIKTNDKHTRADPDIRKVKRQAKGILMPALGEGRIVITQGFIGSSEQNKTTTLGRGGSDYTAALLAEALGAAKLQIWTDVDGIATTDPKAVGSPKIIRQLTFQEASELATAGSKILHPRTIWPARRANIPVFIGNTFNPDSGFTEIIRSTNEKPRVRAIVIKPKQTILRITTPKMAETYGYLGKILRVFTAHKINLDQIATSEITVAFAVDEEIADHEELLEELGRLGTVKLEKNVSGISVIGNAINSSPGLIRDIFNSLESENDKISIRMICQGASEHNICFFVLASEGEKAVRKLHRKLIET